MEVCLPQQRGGGVGGVMGWARTPKALPGDATFITDLKINFEMYKSRYVIYFIIY